MTVKKEKKKVAMSKNAKKISQNDNPIAERDVRMCFEIQNEFGGAQHTDLTNFICDFLADYEDPFSDDAFQAAFHATWGNVELGGKVLMEEIKEYFSSEAMRDEVLNIQYVRVSELAYYFESGHFFPPIWQVEMALDHAQHKYLAHAKRKWENQRVETA